MHGRAMHSRHDALHQALAVLAPPRRFELLMLLLSGVDRSVSQLAAIVRLSQSCTTRHLQSLQRAGLVKGVRDGKRVVFRPAPSGAAAAGVLASLVDDGWLRGETANAPGARRAPARRTADRSGASTSAGRPVREPTSRSDPDPDRGSQTRGPGAPRPRPERPEAAVDPPAPQPAPESGNNSAPAVSPPRFQRELEDYLL